MMRQSIIKSALKVGGIVGMAVSLLLGMADVSPASVSVRVGTRWSGVSYGAQYERYYLWGHMLNAGYMVQTGQGMTGVAYIGAKRYLTSRSVERPVYYMVGPAYVVDSKQAGTGTFGVLGMEGVAGVRNAFFEWGAQFHPGGGRMIAEFGYRF